MNAFIVDHVYLIPLLPLLSAVIILFFGRHLPVKGAPLGILAIATSLVFSADLFLCWTEGSLKLPMEMRWAWFTAGAYPLEWGILLDGPALIMLLVVCTVSFLVQLYSLGYMKGDPRFSRFYAYLSLFTFSMLGLVLANNYLQFFVGWEIMGACSYLLISFEFERDAAAAAGNKAFLTTRLGDLGFYAGLLAVFSNIGSFNFLQIQARLHEGAVSPNMAFAIAMMFFCAAVGKSAQLPLHTWLPDAMEGPTPVWRSSPGPEA
jgi:NADH-quinone oxidoreductase subunit L